MTESRRPSWRQILTEAADTQHTAALTWQECRAILDELGADVQEHPAREEPCCPGAGTMAHVRGCPNHPEAGR